MYAGHEERQMPTSGDDRSFCGQALGLYHSVQEGRLVGIPHVGNATRLCEEEAQRRGGRRG